MDSTMVDPLAPYRTNESTASQGLEAQDLGRDEFLQLLVAKLENQDPLNPTQDTEFVAQLATFSSLEQLMDANQTLQSLAVGQSDLINAQALDLIGKNALVESGNEVRIKDGKPDTLVYAVPRDAREVQMTILGSDGAAVRTFELETSPNGRVTLDWDGTGDDGEPLADGNYTIQISATDLEGEPMNIALFRSLPIDGVTFVDGLISLVSGDRIIPFETILEFRADTSQSS